MDAEDFLKRFDAIDLGTTVAGGKSFGEQAFIEIFDVQITDALNQGSEFFQIAFLFGTGQGDTAGPPLVAVHEHIRVGVA